MINKSNLLKNMLEDSQIKFTTDKVELELYQGEDYISSKADLNWSVDFEYRSWGIKGIYPIVPNQKLHFTYEVETEDSYEDKDMDVEITDVQTKFETPYHEDIISMQVLPVKIEIDKKGKVTVIFQIS